MGSCSLVGLRNGHFAGLQTFCDDRPIGFLPVKQVRVCHVRPDRPSGGAVALLLCYVLLLTLGAGREIASFGCESGMREVRVKQNDQRAKSQPR